MKWKLKTILVLHEKQYIIEKLVNILDANPCFHDTFKYCLVPLLLLISDVMLSKSSFILEKHLKRGNVMYGSSIVLANWIFYCCCLSVMLCCWSFSNKKKHKCKTKTSIPSPPILLCCSNGLSVCKYFRWCYEIGKR